MSRESEKLSPAFSLLSGKKALPTKRRQATQNWGKVQGSAGAKSVRTGGRAPPKMCYHNGSLPPSVLCPHILDSPQEQQALSSKLFIAFFSFIVVLGVHCGIYKISYNISNDLHD
jgi:hypothetical protein